MDMQMTLLRGRDMRMPGRLEQVEHTLHAALGGALLGACPELAYTVNELLFRFMRTSDSLALLCALAACRPSGEDAAPSAVAPAAGPEAPANAKPAK